MIVGGMLKQINLKRVIIPINGGFYKFKSGSFKYIWDDFSLNTEYWQLHYYNKGDVHYKYYGEQNYVFWKLDEHKANIKYLFSMSGL